MSSLDDYFTLADDLKYTIDQVDTVFSNRKAQGLKVTGVEKAQYIMLTRCLKFLRENQNKL